MNESILNSIKVLLGVSPEDTSFDDALVMHINTAFGYLEHLGLGPTGGFSISSSEETWSQYLTDEKFYHPVKSYIAAKVHLSWDTPQSSFVTTAIENQVSEAQWRLMIMAECNRIQETEDDIYDDDYDFYGDDDDT